MVARAQDERAAGVGEAPGGRGVERRLGFAQRLVPALVGLGADRALVVDAGDDVGGVLVRSRRLRVRCRRAEQERGG